MKIMTDEPSVDGILDFSQYSTAFSGIIKESKPQFSIGIFGEWGTGKTTLMKMIYSQISTDPNILPIWFDAWMYENEELFAAIPLLKAITAKMDAKEIFKPLWSFFKDAIIKLSKASKFSVNTGIFTYELETAVFSESDAKKVLKTTYAEVFGTLGKNIKKFREENEKMRIVVFVDDLDRCRPEKGLEILESIKI